MRVLKSLIVGIGLLVFGTTQVYGLGLGDIELNSNLNQPLKAKIELLVVDPDELKLLKVRLADKVAYEAAGVEHIKLLNDLVFKVVAVNGDKVVIEVTTVAPVREPFLDFIIEANWAAGRLLREYTLLLDPPIYAQERTAPIVAAQTIQLSSPAVDAPPTLATSETVASSSASAAKQSTDPVKSTKNEYGPVKNDENLWRIAENIRTDGVTTEQAMMGLFKVNPGAFADNNINNLQAGHVLRVPDAAALQKLSHSEAAKQARQHYNDWLGQRRVAAAASNKLPGNNSAGLAARAETSDVLAVSSAGSAAQLRLVSPEEGGDGLSGTGSEGLSATDLARVQAAEASVAAQTLQTRIQELESKLSQKERLLTLQNDALYELQQQLGSQNDLVKATEFTDADAANDPTTIPLPSDINTDEVLTKAELDESAEETTIATEEDVKSAPSVAVTAEVDQQATVAENNWLGLLEDTNILLLGVGVLLLIGALIWGWVRRRQLVAEEAFDSETFALLPGELQTPASDGEIGIVQAEKEQPESILSESRLMPEEAESDIFAEDSTVDIGSFEADDADEIDPLAEADVYLAYRRYQQAEDLIRSALEQDPESEQLQMKLMEIYYGSENQLAFEAEAEAIFARQGGGQAAWSQIVEMGRELCPTHPLFGETNAIDTAELDSISLDEDINLDSFDLDDADVLPSEDNIFAVMTPDNDVSAEIVAEMDDHSDGLDSLLDGEIEGLGELEGLENLAVDVESIDARGDHAEPLASIDDMPISDEAIIEETDNDIASLLEDLDSFAEKDSGSAGDKDIVTNRVTEELPAAVDSSQDLFEEIPSFDKEGAQAANQINTEAELSADNVVDFDSSEFAHSGRVIHGGENDLQALDVNEAGIDENSVEFDAESQKLPLSEADAVAEKFVADDLGLNDVAELTSDESGVDEKLSDVVVQTKDTDIDFVAGLDLSGLGGDITSDDFSSTSEYLQNYNEDSSAEAEIIIPLPETDDADVMVTVNEIDEQSGNHLFGGMDAVGTKLDLARAYIEMEDRTGARDILEEVLEEGSDDQKQEAEAIMHNMG